MSDHDEEFLEDLDSIAAILADGYLRYRRNRRKDLLDTTAEASPHGHEVNASEKGEGFGDSDSKEIEALRRMTVGSCAGGTARCSARRSRSQPQAVSVPPHRLADPGDWPRAVCRNGRAAARWRSPTTPTCAFARRKDSTFEQDFSRSSGQRGQAGRGPAAIRDCPRGGAGEREYKGREHHRESPRGGLRVRRASATDR